MIKRTVLRVVKRAYASGPGWNYVARMVRKPGTMVLTYHRITGRGPELDAGFEGISAEMFRRQMQWVRKHCDVIDPENIRDRVGDDRRGRPSVLVTFDDGYRDYHDVAYPILKDLGIPAVVFLVTDAVDRGETLWTDNAEWMIRKTPRAQVTIPWSKETVRLEGVADRNKAIRNVKAHLKKLPDAERRTQLDALAKELEPPQIPTRQIMNWDEIRKTMDLTTWGGHTHTHPILPSLGRAEAAKEVNICHERITKETGKAPTHFAYPNGDFTDETKAVVREAGFTTAYTTIDGIASSDTDWLSVRRVPCGDYDPADFAWVAAGWHARA